MLLFFAFFFASGCYPDDFEYSSPVRFVGLVFGGYQPAQKWLKDRKGRKLEFDDIEHYRKIIAVLMETARIMKQIDDPNAQVEELKHKVQDLEHQLQAVQSTSEVKIVGSNVTFIDNSTNYNIKK